MTREEIGNLIAEYPSKKDTHELWVLNEQEGWGISSCSDPIDLVDSMFAGYEYELREKRKMPDQSIFDGAPEWVDCAMKQQNGDWRFFGHRGDHWMPAAKVLPEQPTGLDHIYYKDSKIRRATQSD